MAKTSGEPNISDLKRNIERNPEEEMEIEVSEGPKNTTNVEKMDQELDFGINREPFCIKTDSEPSDMDSDTKDR